MTGDELTAEDQIYREMRTRLDAMGPVNMMALEEYKETAERQTFLETQRKDLLDSIENTQATIKEIDVFSRQKFEEAFHRINENFQATFKKLFGGGHAFMRLTDEENSAESGIDVVASPPGKKLQNVLLLSGGEKALTALSLLVGIFQYQPSPFCILDEVDAPLDEANIAPLHRTGERNERADAIRPHHSQQEDDEHCARTLRRDHAGARRFEIGLGAFRGDGLTHFDRLFETRGAVLFLGRSLPSTFSSVFPQRMCPESPAGCPISGHLDLVNCFPSNRMHAFL